MSANDVKFLEKVAWLAGCIDAADKSGPTPAQWAAIKQWADQAWVKDFEDRYPLSSSPSPTLQSTLAETLNGLTWHDMPDGRLRFRGDVGGRPRMIVEGDGGPEGLMTFVRDNVSPNT